MTTSGTPSGPSIATIKHLFAHAAHCAYPNCDQPLFRSTPSGERVLNVDIAHIRARSPGGPRFDEQVPATRLHSEANLVLLCTSHHREVDDPRWVDQYPEEALLEWKARQLADHDRRGEGTQISDGEARQALTQLSLAIVGSEVDLGGRGGDSPGAGGGGGGAIGPGARGGDGGSGGSIVECVLPLSSLPSEVPVYVGPPGRGGQDGGDGESGGEVRFGDFLSVKGGAGGRAPSIVETGATRVPGVLGCSAMLADEATLSDTGVDLRAAGWCYFSTLTLPTRPLWVVVGALDLIPPAAEEGCDVEIAVAAPRGVVKARVLVSVPGEVRDERLTRRLWIAPIEFEVDEFGLWTVTVSDKAGELVRLSVEVINADRIGARAPNR